MLKVETLQEKHPNKQRRLKLSQHVVTKDFNQYSFLDGRFTWRVPPWCRLLRYTGSASRRDSCPGCGPSRGPPQWRHQPGCRWWTAETRRESELTLSREWRTTPAMLAAESGLPSSPSSSMQQQQGNILTGTTLIRKLTILITYKLNKIQILIWMVALDRDKKNPSVRFRGQEKLACSAMLVDVCGCGLSASCIATQEWKT